MKWIRQDNFVVLVQQLNPNSATSAKTRWELRHLFGESHQLLDPQPSLLRKPRRESVFRGLSRE